MKKTVASTIFFSFLFVNVINANEFRTWTSISGKHETKAEFIKISSDGVTVTLRKTDGKEADVPLEKLSIEDQQYVLKNHGYFTGIRCEYQDVSIDGKLKKVFLIKEILPGSPADKVKTGWTKNSLHRFYFRPIGVATKPENVIDGFYHTKTSEFSFSVSSSGYENFEIVKVDGISKQDWDKAEENRLAREAAEKKAIDEEKNWHREENRERLAQERIEIDARVQAARQNREIEKREREQERMWYAKQMARQRMAYEQQRASERRSAPPPSNTREVSQPQWERCSVCKGTGTRPCATCNGTGKIHCTACPGSNCSYCRGTKKRTCPNGCEGAGKYPCNGGCGGTGFRNK